MGGLREGGNRWFEGRGEWVVWGKWRGDQGGWGALSPTVGPGQSPGGGSRWQSPRKIWRS